MSETCRDLSQNSFEKLANLVEFIIRIYDDDLSPERQIPGEIYLVPVNSIS